MQRIAVFIVALALYASVAQANASRDVPDINSVDVREIQVCLTALGYAPGPIDGVAGERTMRALIQWLTEHNLAGTPGQVSVDIFLQQCKRALGTQRGTDVLLQRPRLLY